MSTPALDSVTRLSYEGRDIYLVGTAHVSKRSVEDVGRVIDEVRPDTVCVELDATRHQALVDPERWRRLDIFEVIRERRTLFLLCSLALSSYQRRLGEKLGVRPGAEMLAAIEHAQQVGARLVLADRDIQATLARTWAALSIWECLQLLGTLVVSMFAKAEITAEQVEALKDRDTINELLKEFAEFMPRLERPLIDERDRYLMSSIREAPGRSVVAVVGAGHVGGMVKYLHADVDRAALAEIPAPSLLRRAMPWFVPVLVLTGLFLAQRARGLDGVSQALVAWCVVTATLAAVSSLALRAHPLSVLAAAVIAPLAPFMPGVTTGLVAASVEARLRPPSAADCEALGRISSRRDWIRNRFTRALLVGAAAGSGASVGSLVGAAWLIFGLG